MSEANAMLRYRRIRRSVRPPRAATIICADGDWRSDVLRMMECYSRTWGGDGDGLVASSSKWDIAESFWPLLTALDPDYWAVFHRTRRGLRMASRDAYEEQLASDISSWMATQPVAEREARAVFETEAMLSQSSTGPVPDSLNDHIRRRLAPMASDQLVVHAVYKADEPPPSALVDMCQLTHRPSRVVGIDLSSLPGELQLLVAARTGALAPGHRARLEERSGFEAISIEIPPDQLSQIVEFAWTGQVDMTGPAMGSAITGNAAPPVPTFGEPEFLPDTPLIQSRLGCRRFARIRPGLNDEPVVVVCGDSAEDFCFAFTRERVVGNTLWLPTPTGVGSEEVNHILHETLTRVLFKFVATPTGNRQVVLTSLTLSESQLEEVLSALGSTTWGMSFNTSTSGAIQVAVCSPNSLSAQCNYVLLDAVHFDDTLYEPFVGADLARSIEIPRPSEARGLRAESCRWQVEMEVPDNILPARWALHPLLTANDENTVAPWAVRSSTSGVSVDSHGRSFVFGGSSLSQILVDVRLRFPGAYEIFSTLLKPSGVSIEESDKGRYMRRMVELWGDLASLAKDLGRGSEWSLLASWAYQTVEGDLGRVYQDRKFLRLRDVASIAGLSEENARELLDRYQHRNIATRGLVLQCSMCAGTAFYRLEDIGPGFQCQRCRKENEIERRVWKGPEEPEWFYALDEVVYQGIIHNSRIPVLALAQLAKGTRSFLYMPEVDVHRPGCPDIEVDLWAIVDGRIVVGEAKVSDRLEKTAAKEKSRCAMLRDLLTDLTADEFVMATASSQWSRVTAQRAEEIIKPAADIRWLTNLN